MPTSKPKVALLDADYLCYSVAFSCEGDSLQWAERRLNEWITDIVFMDLRCESFKGWITGGGNFRKDIAVTQEYKANRKDKPKPAHLEGLRKYIQRMGIEVAEGQEADDAVAIEHTQNPGIVVSNDKDLDQLPGWHYNPQKCLEYYIQPFEGLKKFYTQVLTGDQSDHIPGLYKVGPKTAEKLLKDCTTEKELYEAVLKAYTEREKTQEYLLEQAQLLWLRRTPNELWRPPV
jgi:5'-3' exonuclease